MGSEHVGIVDSQRLYEFVLSKEGKLPETYKMKDTIYTLKKNQLEKIYDIVATNRARTRATTVDLELDDNANVTKIIESQAHRIAPHEIPKPRPAPKKLSKKYIT